MHIPDGFLTPEVCAASGAVSAAAVGYSLYRMRHSLAERTVPLTGMTAAFIFAGQMVNFRVPIALLGVPVSGHLMGGVLAAALLGPWAGCVAMFLVLAVQCLMFADGGLLALGANTLNMAVVGAWGGYPVYRLIRRSLGETPTGTVVGVVVASWLTVMAAAALFCVELGLSLRGSGLDLGRIFSLMVTVHSAIGVGEALITGTVVAFVLSQRPDLLAGAEPTTPAAPGRLAKWGQTFAVGLVAALAVAAFLAPFASGAPDGLEAVAGAARFEDRGEPTRLSLLSDYAIPSPVSGWRDAPWWQRVTVSLAGIFGTLAVAAVAVVLGRAARPKAALNTAGAQRVE
jgi:cobalt/nickel transport system permease protein